MAGAPKRKVGGFHDAVDAVIPAPSDSQLKFGMIVHRVQQLFRRVEMLESARRQEKSRE